MAEVEFNPEQQQFKRALAERSGPKGGVLVRTSHLLPPIIPTTTALNN